MTHPDWIHVQGLRLWAHVGVLEMERAQGQWFELEFWLAGDLAEAARSDRLAASFDYALAITALQRQARQLPRRDEGGPEQKAEQPGAVSEAQETGRRAGNKSETLNHAGKEQVLAIAPLGGAGEDGQGRGTERQGNGIRDEQRLHGQGELAEEDGVVVEIAEQDERAVDAPARVGVRIGGGAEPGVLRPCRCQNRTPARRR